MANPFDDLIPDSNVAVEANPFDDIIPPKTSAGIDLNRPALQNPDGSFSTERTITIEADGRFLNIPTIVNGRQVSQQEAIEYARKTGENFGSFNTVEEAEEAAQQRSQKIGELRKNPFDDLIPSKNPFDDIDDVPTIDQPQETKQTNIFQKKIQAIDPSGQLPSDQLKDRLPPPASGEEKAAFDAEIEKRKTFEQGLKNLQSGKQPKEFVSPNIKQAEMIDGIKIEAMKDEAKINPYLSQFYSALASTDLAILRLPALAIDVMVLPTNMLERAIGYGPGTWQSAPWLMNNQFTKYYEDFEKSYNILKTDPKFKNENLSTLVGKKDYPKAGEYLAHQFIANTPNQIMIIAGALTGVGPAVTLGTMGAMEASRANKENRDKEIDTITSTADAVLKGGFEAVWESAGTFGLVKWGEKLFEGVGRQTGKEIVKNVFKVSLGSTLGEGNEEFWTSLSQDFTDKVLGVEDIPFKEFLPRALEAATVGALSGLSMSAPVATVSGLSRAKLESQIKKLNDVSQKAEEMRTRAVLPAELKPQEPISIPAEQILKEKDITTTIYEHGGSNVKFQKGAKGETALVNFDLTVDKSGAAATISMKPEDINPEKVKAKVQETFDKFAKAEKESPEAPAVVPFKVKIGDRSFPISSLEEASKRFQASREEYAKTYGVGSSETPTPLIYDDKGKLIGHISYNGNIWEGQPQDWTSETNLLYGKRFSQPPVSKQPIKVYHGTKYQFNDFDVKHLGKLTKAESAKNAFFFTDKKEIAEGYASLGDMPKVEELQAEVDRLEKIAKRSGENSDWDKHQAALEKYEDAALGEENKNFAGQVKEVYLDLKNPFIVDKEGFAYNEKELANWVKEAKAKGHDGVIIKNAADAVTTKIRADGKQPDSEISNIYAVFSPSQIQTELQKEKPAEVTPPQEQSEQEFEQEPEESSLSFGENIAEAIKPESESIARLETRLNELTDLKEKANLAREAREELSPILELVDKRIKIPKKSEPLFEEGQAVPSRFRNKTSGLPLDEILEELNNADVGINLQTTSELREFLNNLDKRIGELDKIVLEGKVPVLTKRETTEIRQRIKDIRQGIREGRIKGRGEVKSAKEILERRRNLVKGARDQFGLTDAQLRKISKKDIRLMSNYEFHKFLDDLRAKGAAEAVSRDIKNQILFQIQDKELQKVDNLRQYMKFPSLDKMTVQQLNEFNQALEETQQGDEFLSIRKLETVKNTELAGIKTVREAKEILAKRLGVSLEKVSNINVTPIDKFRFDTALARRNPFYQFLVDETSASLLDGEERFLEMEREIDDLTNKARRSRERRLVEKLVPTDELVFEWLESKSEKEFDPEVDKGRTKEAIAKVMTAQEIDLANYLQVRFAQFRDYLIQQGTLEKYQSNYITHIRRGFLETWKQDGLLNAFKEVFKQYKEDEVIFKILEDDTQNILPLEKFFQFAMHRSGELKPSKNVAKAFKAYTKAMLKKQSLDKIVPALDIYAYSLSPKAVTPRGLEMDRRLIKFVHEWVNNKKGRKTSLGGILPQGGAVDIGLRAIDGFITLIDLGLNIPVSLTVQIGEQVSTFVNLGVDRYSRGIQRMNTPKGKKILSENEAFVGKSPWRELSNTASDIGDKFNTGLFSLFDVANITANKIHLLGSLTVKEWEAGEISAERKASIKRDIGRFRNVAGSKSIFGSTSFGSTLSKYKTWAIPIFRTLVFEDIPAVVKMAGSGDFNTMVKSREFNEIFRSVLTTSLFILAARGLIDDDDDSFLGYLLNKAYSETLTILGALDPTVLVRVRLMGFLSDLADSIKMIVLLEEYKNKDGYKGVAKLQRTLTPRAIKQFS